MNSNVIKAMNSASSPETKSQQKVKNKYFY